MMLVLNIELFKIRLCGVYSNKAQRTNQMGLVRLFRFRLTSQNIWYIQHCSDTPHTMFELTPRVGFVRTVKNLTLTCFSDFVINLRTMYAKNSNYS